MGVPGMCANSDSGATWSPEVASVCPGDPWSSVLLRRTVNLGASWEAQAFWSFAANLDVSINTAFKVKARPYGRTCPHLIPDLLTMLENKVSFVCFLVTPTCFFLLTLLDTQYLANAECFPLHWEVGYEVC